MMELKLPYPPTLNTYWRHVGHQVKLSKKGREYRKAVALAVVEWWEWWEALRREKWEQFTGDVEVRIVAHPPDRRRRDLDNLPKAILDALEHAGVFEDDNQVARLVIERGPMWSGGEVHVTVATMSDGED